MEVITRHACNQASYVTVRAATWTVLTRGFRHRTVIVSLWILLTILIVSCESRGIPMEKWPAYDRIGFEFAVALLEHDDRAYELASPETHVRIVEWFESTRPVDCNYPENLTLNPQVGESLVVFTNYTIVCHSSTPGCELLRLTNLTLRNDDAEEAERYLVNYWWEQVEYCDSIEKFNNVVLTPLPYFHPPLYLKDHG